METTERPSPLGQVAFVLAALSTAAFVARLLALSDHGLDFSDEGYYLASMADPSLYRWTASQFGFVLHPLHRFLDGNVAWLRAVNVLATFGVATVMFRELLRQDGDDARTRSWIVAGAFATAAFALFAQWLITPNYNTLTCQALCLAVIGWARARSFASPLGPVLLGVAGSLAFLAKPTTGVLLGATMLVAITAWPAPTRWRQLAIAVLVAGLCVLAFGFAIDGGVDLFLDRLRGGARVMSLLGSRYGFAASVRWDDFAWTTAERVVVWTTATIAAFGVWPARWRRGDAIPAGTTLVLLAAAAWVFWRGGPPLPRTHFVTMILSGPALGVALSGVFANRRPVDARALIAGVAIGCIPAVYAFGTNNDYWYTGSHAAVFWIAGALVVHRALRTSRAVDLLPAAIATQALAWTLVLIADAHPYRQVEPASRQSTPLRLLGSGPPLQVSVTYAAYVESFRALARTAGFQSGTPVVDLTGQSPLALYAIGARQVGLAWWAGGYPGSDTLAAHVVDSLDCATLARAWVLVEPGGPRALDTAVSLRFGASVERDYAIAVEVDTPPGAGEYPQPRRQQLLRPTRPTDLARGACEALRDGP